MTDIPFHDVPDEVVTAIDHATRQLGGVALSVTVDDLTTAAGLCSDLLDPEVMDRAWQ